MIFLCTVFTSSKISAQKTQVKCCLVGLRFHGVCPRVQDFLATMKEVKGGFAALGVAETLT